MEDALRSAKAEATRARFLELALESITQSGIASLSASDLVKRSGVSRPTFYSYFGDVDGLLAELWLAYGEAWACSMLLDAGPGIHEAPESRALCEVFLQAHRNQQVREVVSATLHEVLERELPEPGRRSVGLWRMANRIGARVTAASWPQAADALFLDSYLDSIDGKVSRLAPTGSPELPAIAWELEEGTDPSIVEGVIQIVGSSGVGSLSILRLGRVLRVTSGYLNPRISNLPQLVADTYRIAQDSAARQNMATWSALNLKPEGFARFVVGSVGEARAPWRRFRTEVLVAAAYSEELGAAVAQSMDEFIQRLRARTSRIGLPVELAERVALLVHTLLVGFAALDSAGVSVRSLAHEGVIRALVGETAKRFVGIR
jgi:AcrR family transcriptional regulator